MADPWWVSKIPATLPPVAPASGEVFPFEKPVSVPYWMTEEEVRKLKTCPTGIAIPATGVPFNANAIGAPREYCNKGDFTPTRYHCGVDLIQSVGTPIKSCANGTILRFRPFYQNTYALFVDYGDYIINYGEVNENSIKELGLKEGDSVSAGQRIATVGNLSKSSMLHIEFYNSSLKGTFTDTPTRPSVKIGNQQWKYGNPPPEHLLDGTLYLLTLANKMTKGKYDYVLANYQCR